MLILAEPFQIVPHVPVTPDFLLHIAAPHFDQYWLQVLLVYAILSDNIVRDTGQNQEILWKEGKPYDLHRGYKKKVGCHSQSV